MEELWVLIQHALQGEQFLKKGGRKFSEERESGGDVRRDGRRRVRRDERRWEVG